MKINKHILSIPPYISTAWDNVSHLQMNSGGDLEVILHNGTKVSIPNLSAANLEKIFAAHALSIESAPADGSDNHFGISLNPSGMVLSGMENFTGMMQHDPNQKDAPSLPSEILEKISEMGKAMGVDKDTFNIPEGDSNCNCPYCQISRAVHGQEHLYEREDNSLENEVSKEELTFREWNITQKNDKLYEVTNPFEESEKYSVYLGDPIGCTCGKNNCEHILAVLKS